MVPAGGWIKANRRWQCSHNVQLRRSPLPITTHITERYSDLESNYRIKQSRKPMKKTYPLKLCTKDPFVLLICNWYIKNFPSVSLFSSPELCYYCLYSCMSLHDFHHCHFFFTIFKFLLISKMLPALNFSVQTNFSSIRRMQLQIF